MPDTLTSISPKYCWMLLESARAMAQTRDQARNVLMACDPDFLSADRAYRAALTENFLQQEVPALLCRADPAGRKLRVMELLSPRARHKRR